MVTEFCARGSMYDVLQKAANSPMVLAPQLDWTRRLGMALDAAKVSTMILTWSYAHANSYSLAFCPPWDRTCMLEVHDSDLTMPTPQILHAPPSFGTPLIPQGLFQLHSHRPVILHRDLKSPNLLVDKHWRVKVRRASVSPRRTALSRLHTNPDIMS